MNEQPKQEIFKAIQLVMAKIEPITKDRQNKQQGYAYRGVDDVMNALSPLMAEVGIFPIASVHGECLRFESFESKNGNQGFHIIQDYVITLYALDGSSVSGVSRGEAMDYGDKASGKACSYAYRDFLMKTFVIPTQEEKDTDAQSHDLKPKQPIQQPEPQTGKSGRKISEPQAKRLWALAKKRGTDIKLSDAEVNDAVKRVIKSLGYVHTTDIDSGDYEQVCNEVERISF